MPDDYEKLKRELSERFEYTVREFESAFHYGIEVPGPIEDKYDLAASKYEEANKKFPDGGKEAVEVMKKAIDYSDQALIELLKFFLSDSYQKACDARKFFEGYEYIASAHIKDYSKHTVNFRKIREFIEEHKSPDISLSDDIRSHTFELNSFLFDFGSVKEAVSSEINREKEAKKRFWIGTGLTCVVIFLSIITIVVMVKGCSDSSQQTAQPEASASETELQSEANNPTPNP